MDFQKLWGFFKSKFEKRVAPYIKSNSLYTYYAQEHNRCYLMIPKVSILLFFNLLVHSPKIA